MNKKLLIIFLCACTIVGFVSGVHARILGDIVTDAKNSIVFDNKKIKDIDIKKISDKSSEVYLTKDGFGIGFTSAGEVTLNYKDIRIYNKGLSGFVAYDKDNPKKLYIFEPTKISKTSLLASCKELGANIKFDINSNKDCIEFNGKLDCDKDENLVFAFAIPMDGTTSLNKDVAIWIKDLRRAYECKDATLEYTNAYDDETSKYPIAAMLTSSYSIAIANTPSSTTIGRFFYSPSAKSLVSSYDVNLKANKGCDISFVVYKFAYEWGFRGAYKKYTDIFPEAFTSKINIRGNGAYNLSAEDAKDLKVEFLFGGDNNKFICFNNENEFFNNSEYKTKVLKNISGTSFIPSMTFDGYYYNPTFYNGDKFELPNDEELCYIKTLAGNKPIFLEIGNLNEKDLQAVLSMATFYGMNISFSKDFNFVNNRTLIRKYVSHIDTITKATWQPISMCESNNSNVYTEKYTDSSTNYVLAFNASGIRRAASVIIYDLKNEENITNIVDNSKYPVKNNSLNVVLNPYQVAIFKY